MGYWIFWYGGWTGPEWTLPGWRPPRLRNPLLDPDVRVDAEALLFSVKTFAAAMLAYYVALRIGLSRPSWAIVTVYLVSQTSAGASLGRGVYRMMGTLTGAVATVAIVPTFANEPVICSMVLAGWIGLCLFLSLLDRTPRAYAFVLSGYTASLIGFPAVATPGAIFDTASIRVQEIALGILCAVLVHRYVLPRPMTGQFRARLAAMVGDARRLTRDALEASPTRERSMNRHRLALDLLAVRGMATHLPYDPDASRPDRATLQLLHDRLVQLMPLLAGIEERIDAIGTDGPAELSELLRDMRRWIACDVPFERDAGALWLSHRARALAHDGAACLPDPFVANLAGHLADLVALLHDIERLGHEARTGTRRRQGAVLLGDPQAAAGHVFHRDPLMAARGAIGAALGITLGCLAWIWSAWPDGGLAVSVLGVTCALFGNVDAPSPNVRRYMVGSIYGVAISLAYSFVVLPRVTDFAALVACLAPVLLLAGSLQARPATAFMALGMTLTIPILVGLGADYGGDFAEAINSSIALFVGVGLGAVSMGLLQTVAVDAAIDRLLRLSRRDVARRARGRGPADAHWAGLMIDRMALLLPRLGLSSRSPSQGLEEALRHLRVGHAAGRLHRRLRRGPDLVTEEAHRLLSDIADGCRGARTFDPADARRGTEGLIALIAATGLVEHRALLNAVIDLWFALPPVASGETGT